ncbi:unnamed protein product [Caenorhabditis brenneri]
MKNTATDDLQVKLTQHQLNILNSYYRRNQVDLDEIQKLSDALGVTVYQILAWLQSKVDPGTVTVKLTKETSKMYDKFLKTFEVGTDSSLFRVLQKLSSIIPPVEQTFLCDSEVNSPHMKIWKASLKNFLAHIHEKQPYVIERMLVAVGKSVLHSMLHKAQKRS